MGMDLLICEIVSLRELKVRFTWIITRIHCVGEKVGGPVWRVTLIEGDVSVKKSQVHF